MKKILLASLIFVLAFQAYSKEDFILSKGAITYTKKTDINGEIKEDKQDVFYIFSGKDIDGDKVTDLLCAFRTGETGLAILNKDGKTVKKFIPIGTKEKPVNDMCFGDVYNDKTQCILTIGGDYLNIYRYKDQLLQSVETRNLYTAGDYGLEKLDKDTVQLKKNSAIEGTQVAVGDIDSDNKNEIVLTKLDTFKKYRFATFIFQILRWDGKNFKQIYYKGGNNGLGNDTQIFIEDLNLDMINDYVFDGKLNRYKAGYITAVYEGLLGAGKIGEKKVFAACVAEPVKDKEGRIAGYSKDKGLVRLTLLTKQTFTELADKKALAAGTIYQKADFEQGGKAGWFYESETTDRVVRMVFCDIDNDGKNELVLDSENGFSVLKENK